MTTPKSCIEYSRSLIPTELCLLSGIHAREWISPAVATYMISELVERDADHPQYLDNINFYFLPVANPDGYEYTRSDVRHFNDN